MSKLRAEFVKVEALKPPIPVIQYSPVPATTLKGIEDKIAQTYKGIAFVASGSDGSATLSAVDTDYFPQFLGAINVLENAGRNWRVNIVSLCAGQDCATSKLSAILKIEVAKVGEPPHQDETKILQAAIRKNRKRKKTKPSIVIVLNRGEGTIMKKTSIQRKGERGNALFLILIAVALFAALSYAVTQSGRSGSGGVSKETGTLNAGQITDYPASIRTTITRMILTGGATSGAIDFRTTTDSVNAVFTNPTGGGAVSLTAPSTGTVGSACGGNGQAGSGGTGGGDTAASVCWRYKAANVGAANGAYFIKGVGTDTADTGRDGFAFLGVSLAACTAINTGLSVTIFYPSTATVFTDSTATHEGTALQESGQASGGAGGTNDANTIENLAATAPAIGCYSNNNANTTSGPFVYYHALIEN